MERIADIPTQELSKEVEKAKVAKARLVRRANGMVMQASVIGLRRPAKVGKMTMRSR